MLLETNSVRTKYRTSRSPFLLAYLATGTRAWRAKCWRVKHRQPLHQETPCSGVVVYVVMCNCLHGFYALGHFVPFSTAIECLWKPSIKDVPRAWQLGTETPHTFSFQRVICFSYTVPGVFVSCSWLKIVAARLVITVLFVALLNLSFALTFSAEGSYPKTSHGRIFQGLRRSRRNKQAHRRPWVKAGNSRRRAGEHGAVGNKWMWPWSGQRNYRNRACLFVRRSVTVNIACLECVLWRVRHAGSHLQAHEQLPDSQGCPWDIFICPIP